MTIRDIAKNLGVSYSTVSRCLNNDPKVSEKTRKKVVEEANRLGFEFNMNARSLVTNKTNRIGIIFSNKFNLRDYRWFFNEIETYSTKSVEDNGYDFLVQPNKNSSGLSNIVRMVSGKMVDGLAIFSKDISETDYKFLNESKFPHVYVYFNPPCGQIVPNNFFWDDNQFGGYLATKHLIQNGHQKILTIRSDDPTQKMYDDRTEGYLSAMNEFGLQPHIIKSDMNFLPAKELVGKQLDLLMQFTAIFSQQDLPALSIAQELQKRGIAIPNDVSIIGYNNIELISYLDILLDTIADPREKVIENAINSLVCQIEKKEDFIPRKIYPKLIKRGSVKKLI